MKRLSLLVSLLLLAGCGPAAMRELPPAPELPCFPGAYYRKAVTSTDDWSGIEGILTLPDVHYDSERTRPATGRPLDNASIYLGGRAAGQEVDAGLTWEVIREADGSVSRAGKAFRPFWRVERWNNAPARPDYYYYPGDTLRMGCRMIEPGKLELRIELLERGEHLADGVFAHRAVGPRRLAPPETGFSATTPLSVFTAVFDAASFRPEIPREFKRVNAIDQSGNEGKGVQPTRARVLDAVWHEVWLFRGDEGKQRYPMTAERFTDMRCPSSAHHRVAPAGADAKGGERISIYGTPE
jgi:hypothetical protein